MSFYQDLNQHYFQGSTHSLSLCGLQCLIPAAKEQTIQTQMKKMNIATLKSCWIQVQLLTYLKNWLSDLFNRKLTNMLKLVIFFQRKCLQTITYSVFLFYFLIFFIHSFIFIVQAMVKIQEVSTELMNVTGLVRNSRQALAFADTELYETTMEICTKDKRKRKLTVWPFSFLIKQSAFFWLDRVRNCW